jgi:hypothetical protein
MTSDPKKYENHKELRRTRYFCTLFVQTCTGYAYIMCILPHDRRKRKMGPYGASELASQGPEALPAQKWTMRSAAPITE